MTQRFLLFLCALLAIPAKAADLQLTPSLCAVSEDESSCSVSVKVRFTADDSERYCLSIIGKGLIRCFSGKTEKNLEVYIHADHDTQFTVTEGESGERVASAVLKVAQYQPKRHRRRYGWGLL
ncbi:DUF3019 domain-containing protein [Microbulbifer sp.]|uniref:DUF3019 domain-containing protein n=1 Tax=Microbulbifer sp. TaxID=1908541 RepID=UPI002F92F76C